MYVVAKTRNVDWKETDFGCLGDVSISHTEISGIIQSLKLIVTVKSKRCCEGFVFSP